MICCPGPTGPRGNPGSQYNIAAATDDVQITTLGDQIFVNAGHTSAAPDSTIIFGGEATYVGKNLGDAARSVIIGATRNWDAAGPGSVCIGYDTGRRTGNTGIIAIGEHAGSNGQENHALAIGFGAAGVGGGGGSQGESAIAIGNSSGAQNQGVGAISIGYQAAFSNQPDYSIALGYDCDTPNAVGRLSFGGSNLEALTAISTVSEESLVGLFRIDHRGTEYQIPLLSSTATDLLKESPKYFVGWGPLFNFPNQAFTAGVDEVIPIGQAGVDTNGFTSLNSNSRARCDVVGGPFKYKVSGGTGINSSGNGVLKLFKNGVTIGHETYTNSGSINMWHANLECLMTLAQNDYVELIWSSPGGESPREVTGTFLNIIQLTF